MRTAHQASCAFATGALGSAEEKMKKARPTIGALGSAGETVAEAEPGSFLPSVAETPKSNPTKPNTLTSPEQSASYSPAVTHNIPAGRPSTATRRAQQALDSVAASTQPQQNVSLAFKELGDGGCQDLAVLIAADRIATLDCSNNSIGCTGATTLAAALANNKSVSSLDISANAIGNEGCKALARALEYNTTLKHLDLHACNLNDDAATALAACLRVNTAIAILNLKANYIGDAGAIALAKAATQSASLRCLVTSSNDITRAGQV